MKTLALLSAVLGGLLLASAAWCGTKPQSLTTSQPAISVDIDEPTKPGPADGFRGLEDADFMRLRQLEGDYEITARPAKVAGDTVWIADWSFDGGGCTGTGWSSFDNRIANDGSNWWCVSAAYDTLAPIENKAAVLHKHDLCWSRDGYGNDWDYSIRVQYPGGAGDGRLSFNFASDSEVGYDFVQVEADSLCLSQNRVDFTLHPGWGPEKYRETLFSTDGLNTNGVVTAIVLPDYGPGTHCVLIRFFSDGSASDEDGGWPSGLGAALVVDSIAVDMPPLGPGGADYTEMFEAASGCGASATGLNANVSFINSANSKPFGEWARLFQHVTDNDKCTENTTCSWLNSDPALPAYFPDMAFGPGGAVVRNWLDDALVSPWVSLASTPSAPGTALSFRSFPGNPFSKTSIVQSWRVRSRKRTSNTDTSTLGDSIDCLTSWRPESDFRVLSSFTWQTNSADMSPDLDPGATAIQVSFRVTDWQYIANDAPPQTLNAGPGPFTDRVRIGRRVLTGPVISEGIDSRSQAQDAFGSVDNAIAPGEHHSPSTTSTRRFDAVPFDQGADLGVLSSPNIVSGDSIHVSVSDVRGAGGITWVKFYGAIVKGAHTGNVPPGAVAGPGGLFVVTADSCRARSGVALADEWFVDLSDHYLRGGDEVVYFWGAKDNGNGFTSDPPGIPNDGAGNPAVTSVADAEAKTGGLLGMSALPAIQWDSSYLAAVAALPPGASDPGPTPQQISSSTQKNCILYVNVYNSRRRSGLLQRTAFMYTLDRLGYRGYYDVHDVQGYGSTNNQLAGRATEEHATGYSLLVQDAGRLGDMTVPQGVGVGQKVNQMQWYRNWLASGLTSEASTHTLWILGENVVQEVGAAALFGTDMGVSLGSGDNGASSVSPDVAGQAAMTFWDGCTANFTGDVFSLDGGCPRRRNYDGLTATTGTVTHKYKAGTITSPYAAIIMNKSAGLHWNTVMSAFGWFDIRDTNNTPPGAAERTLMAKILSCTLPVSCLRSPVATDDGSPAVETLPAATVLRQNAPNPFNPSTTIVFDLARGAHVQLQIYDVSGRRVRTLVDRQMEPGRDQRVIWTGRDDSGRRLASGLYFYRLSAGDFTATRKMVLLQ